MRKLLLQALLILCIIQPVMATESAWVINKGSTYVEVQPAFSSFLEDNRRTYELSMYNRVEIGWFENSSFFLSLPFRTLSQQISTGNLTNNGLTDFRIGSYFQLLHTPVALTIKGDLSIPTGYDIKALPSIGDGQLDMGLGLLSGYHFDEIPAYIQGKLGFVYHTAFGPEHPIAAQSRLQGTPLIRPAPQVSTMLESGIWIIPEVLVSLGAHGYFALSGEDMLSRSSFSLTPSIAWRLNEFVDVSLQWDQVLWGVNTPLATGIQIGGHFHYGTHLPQAIGIRGE